MARVIEGWRPLALGEIIRATDMFDYNLTGEQLAPAIPLSVGQPFSRSFLQYYRRLIDEECSNE